MKADQIVHTLSVTVRLDALLQPTRRFNRYGASDESPVLMSHFIEHLRRVTQMIGSDEIGEGVVVYERGVLVRTGHRRPEGDERC